MSHRRRWQDRYQKQDTPWEINRPDSHLIRLVRDSTLTPCRILEIGCGTGINAIWLASKGFEVTAIDISTVAIDRARQRIKASVHACKFLEADFLNTAIAIGPFEWILDRGCFHCCETVAERRHFAENVTRHLTDDGMWLSLIGSADDPPRDTGPPRLTAMEIIGVFEPLFEIQRLEAVYFDSNRARPPKAWLSLARKRAG
jgi:2-polyprenyl-3-methyl-5-hydroxy-6-metoxy-1,4-benzoquinol methylase